MNIRYKANGIAVKFDGENYEELFNLLKPIDRSRFTTLEAYKEDAEARANRPLIKYAENEWLTIQAGEYFVSIDEVDIITTETTFNGNFEIYE